MSGPTGKADSGPFKGDVGGECFIESCRMPAVANFYMEEHRPWGIEPPRKHYCQGHGMELRMRLRSMVHELDDEGNPVL